MNILKKENGIVVMQGMKGDMTNRSFINAAIELTNKGVFNVWEFGRITYSFTRAEIQTTEIAPAAAIAAPATDQLLFDLLVEDFFFDVIDAENVRYDNATSGLTADNVQDAIDEVAAGVGSLPTTPPLSPSVGDSYFDTTDGVIKVWNGQFWQGINVAVNQLQNLNDGVLLTAFTSASGTSAISNTSSINVADINSVTTKQRMGSCVISTSPTVGNSVAALFNSTLVNLPRYFLSAVGRFYIGGEWSGFGIINFATDPVLGCFGLIGLTAAATPNPLTGVYHRLPRTGETAFVKYVVRVAGAETVADTSIPVTTNTTGYLKTALYWDGSSMHFIATDGTDYSTNTISNFLATYALGSTDFHAGVYVGRNGTASAPATRSIALDVFEKWFAPNYLKLK